MYAEVCLYLSMPLFSILSTPDMMVAALGAREYADRETASRVLLSYVHKNKGLHVDLYGIGAVERQYLYRGIYNRDREISSRVYMIIRKVWTCKFCHGTGFGIGTWPPTAACTQCCGLGIDGDIRREIMQYGGRW